jgi:hypothetical protein
MILLKERMEEDMRKFAIFALMVLLVLGTSAAWAASGYLIVPDHHAGVVGDNEIEVTATDLEPWTDYLLILDVFYHQNPRIPPPAGDFPPPGYTEYFQFSSDGSDVTKKFVVPMLSCHWQITACFTLYYWAAGEYWLWNGDERATQCVDIWSDDCVGIGCRFTGGGVDTDGNWDHTLESGEMIRNGAGNVPDGIDRAQFGGQAGANTALPPQPAGEWTHHQQRGTSGRFTFHGGTASAPEGTEIIEIRCSDPGGCKPSGDPPSPAKQLDFDGIGTFKSIGNGSNAPVFEIANANVTAEGNGNQAFDGTFHRFEVNIDDLGEKGGLNSGAPNSEECPSAGFGEKGDMELANCDCPDFYRITIYNGVDAADVVWLPNGDIDPNSLPAGPEDVIYEFFGYIDGGNLQIHRLTGFDK